MFQKIEVLFLLKMARLRYFNSCKSFIYKVSKKTPFYRQQEAGQKLLVSFIDKWKIGKTSLEYIFNAIIIKICALHTFVYNTLVYLVLVHTVLCHSRSKQRTDQRVLVLTLKFLALKKLVFPL